MVKWATKGLSNLICIGDTLNRSRSIPHKIYLIPPLPGICTSRATNSRGSSHLLRAPRLYFQDSLAAVYPGIANTSSSAE